MDPLGNQPAQPNPQPPIAPTPLQVPQVPEVPRPDPVTQPVAPLPERPVEAWPPAGTPAAQEAATIAAAPTPQPTPQTPSPAAETQVMGAEIATAAGAIPVIAPAPTINPVMTSPTPQDMNGFITPAAQELRNSVAAAPTPPEKPMSDQQADQLFQEEPATKARNRKHRIKKIMVTLLILIVVVAAAGAAYIFVFGNKAAQSYVDTSSATAYKEAFSEIQASLAKQPVDSAELEAGFNKLKVASDNSKSLAPIPLGSLNPNYKKAKQLADAETAYKSKTKAYQTKYADYTQYLKGLSDSFGVISSIEDLKNIDLTVVTAEKVSTDLTKLIKDCGLASKALGDSTKPSDLSDSSLAVQEYLVKLCATSLDSLQQVPLAFLTGKTGVLSAADQTTLKGYFNAYQNLTALITFSSEQANIEELTGYQQSALQDATDLQKQAEAILKG